MQFSSRDLQVSTHAQSNNAVLCGAMYIRTCVCMYVYLAEAEELQCSVVLVLVAEVEQRCC